MKKTIKKLILLSSLAIFSQAILASEESSVTYKIKISQEQVENKVLVVSESMVVGLNNKDIPISINHKTGYLVLCQDTTKEVAVPCGDMWKNPDQLALHLIPNKHNGIIDTKVIIHGGAGKGHFEPEPQLELGNINVRLNPKEKIKLPVILPIASEKNIHYLIEIEALFN